MSLGILLTMGGIAVGGSIIEKILNKIGETDKAQMVGIVSTGMLASTVVGTVITVFTDVRKLGK